MNRLLGLGAVSGLAGLLFVGAVLTLEGSVASRDHVGGTAPRQVRAAIARHRLRLSGEPGGPGESG